ncbi:MAG: efflux transporter outer membrane subunit [Methylococcaceae bacterium]|nr:efflux transporter outer membrane subunit [Methylococcaceae bacterium]
MIGLQPPQTTVKLPAPPNWQAPLPHGGKLMELKAWWQQFNDPLLLHLIDQAQTVSPSIASAKSRIEQARAKKVGATAALLPDLTANASGSRGLESLFFPAATIGSIGLQTRWELDLFGGNQAAQDAAQARVEGATASWHDARVLVAAEVANQYNILRSCEAQVAFAQTDANSRSETSRLTENMSQAGLKPPADAALASASSAQARNTLLTQSAQCDLAIKALVALTGDAEPKLRKRLQVASGKLAQPVSMTVTAIPGELLAQRPDIIAAGQEVIAASADITQYQAQRYPKISFSGKISMMQLDVAPAPKGGTVWSIGPLAVTLPLFDGGLRVANVEAARARYTEASLIFTGKIRSAVREVEEALVNLHSMGQRNEEVAKAVAGFNTAFAAKEELYKVGLVSLIELEESRRLAVQAKTGQLQLRRDQIAAWISLYRALGGGWTTAEAGKVEPQKALFN